VNAIEAANGYIHAVSVNVTSGQLPFLGLAAPILKKQGEILGRTRA
jgi:hypothetical protein